MSFRAEVEAPQTVTLIEKDDDYYLPEIYDVYEKGYRAGSPEWTKAFHNVQGTRPCPPNTSSRCWCSPTY